MRIDSSGSPSFEILVVVTEILPLVEEVDGVFTGEPLKSVSSRTRLVDGVMGVKLDRGSVIGPNIRGFEDDTGPDIKPETVKDDNEPPLVNEALWSCEVLVWSLLRGPAPSGSQIPHDPSDRRTMMAFPPRTHAASTTVFRWGMPTGLRQNSGERVINQAPSASLRSVSLDDPRGVRGIVKTRIEQSEQAAAKTAVLENICGYDSSVDRSCSEENVGTANPRTFTPSC
ncbi:hypothetical protein I7I51_08495, partial [Histoplasma capsulatum]